MLAKLILGHPIVLRDLSAFDLTPSGLTEGGWIRLGEFDLDLIAFAYRILIDVRLVEIEA